MKEIWKKIPGFDDMYEVSNKGRVRSYHAADGTGGRRFNPRVLTPVKNHINYLFVGLYDNGEQKSKRINRLVAKAFLPNPKNKRFVNHKDGNKQNNEVTNLEWCTQSENELHAYKTGLKNIDHLRGESHPISKMTEDEVLEMRSAYDLGCFTFTDMAKAYGVCIQTVSNIIKRKRWAHI